MADTGSEKPKIIIDEDWKSQVQAEKEALERDQERKEKASAPAAGPLPPASLSVLLSTLATQAMVALAEIPHPLTGKAEIDLDEARHFIDTIQMLDEKTAGNRTPDETLLVDSLLHQLRLSFVAVQTRPAVEPAAPGERGPQGP